LSEYGYAEYNTIGNALIYYGIDTDHPEHYLWKGKEVYETVFFHTPKVGIKNCIGFVPVHGLLHDLYKGY
jgi:hypothetical protein